MEIFDKNEGFKRLAKGFEIRIETLLEVHVPQKTTRVGDPKIYQ
jgi:hypothetical protein